MDDYHAQQYEKLFLETETFLEKCKSIYKIILSTRGGSFFYLTMREGVKTCILLMRNK